jgi:hypothetical protein
MAGGLREKKMNKMLAVLTGTLMSAVWLIPAALAETACVTQNMAVPAGANTSDKKAAFFIDTTGLDFKTAPPTRDPSNPNYPRATELPDGTLPPPDVDGNFIIGPTHVPAAETLVKDGVPRGTITSFTLSSNDSVIYNPGRTRDDPAGCNNGSIMVAMTAPGDTSNLVVTTSHPGTWMRKIDVYVPAQYVRGTQAPFIVIGDGGSAAYKDLATALDNMIAQRRVPPMIAIQIGNGGQDAQGSQRGREYDTVSGTYTEFVERELLPLVEQRADVKLTTNPDGRATMGLSSSGSAAFNMAWFYPDLYRRVLAFSPTMVNQQWPHDPSLRGGAWEYHSPWAGAPGAGISDQPGAPLIPTSPTKPIRFWFMVGDQDLFYPNPTLPDGMHDWTLSNELMAKVLAAKGYHYQFVFVRNAKHVDRPTIAQILPSALEWLWKGYPIP